MRDQISYCTHACVLWNICCVIKIVVVRKDTVHSCKIYPEEMCDMEIESEPQYSRKRLRQCTFSMGMELSRLNSVVGIC